MQQTPRLYWSKSIPWTYSVENRMTMSMCRRVTWRRMFHSLIRCVVSLNTLTCFIYVYSMYYMIYEGKRCAIMLMFQGVEVDRPIHSAVYSINVKFNLNQGICFCSSIVPEWQHMVSRMMKISVHVLLITIYSLSAIFDYIIWATAFWFNYSSWITIT